MPWQSRLLRFARNDILPRSHLLARDDSKKKPLYYKSLLLCQKDQVGIRTFAALLTAVMLFAISGCGLKTDPQPPKESSAAFSEMTDVKS
jgi:predicted small lipoprotein YifL